MWCECYGELYISSYLPTRSNAIKFWAIELKRKERKNKKLAREGAKQSKEP
jgi:hypothetical protein